MTRKSVFLSFLLCLGFAVSAADLPVDSSARDYAASDFPSIWQLKHHEAGVPVKVRLTALSPADDPMNFQVEVYSDQGNTVQNATQDGSFEFLFPGSAIGENTTIIVFDLNHPSRCAGPTNCGERKTYEYEIDVKQLTPARQMLDCSEELWVVEDATDPAVFSIIDAYFPGNHPTACELAQGSELGTTVVGQVSVDKWFPEGTTLVDFHLAAYSETEVLDPLDDYQGNIQVFIKDASNPWGWSYAGQTDLYYNDPTNGQLRTIPLDASLSTLVLQGPVDIKLHFSSRFENTTILFDAMSFSAR